MWAQFVLVVCGVLTLNPLISIEGCTQIEIMAPTGELVVANADERSDDVTGKGLFASVTARGGQHGAHLPPLLHPPIPHCHLNAHIPCMGDWVH
jgi:hypothetical protein